MLYITIPIPFAQSLSPMLYYCYETIKHDGEAPPSGALPLSKGK